MKEIKIKLRVYARIKRVGYNFFKVILHYSVFDFQFYVQLEFNPKTLQYNEGRKTTTATIKLTNKKQ